MAQLAADRDLDVETDTDLAEFGTLWPTLSAPIKAAVMAMVRAYSSAALG